LQSLQIAAAPKRDRKRIVDAFRIVKERLRELSQVYG
jgi:hypothetical protein